MPPPYRGVLFDLFGTLIEFAPERLPHLLRDGVRVPTTEGALGVLLGEVAPGIEPAAFWEALSSVSAELAAERETHHAEHPSRERFRRALARVGVPPEATADAAVLLARAHHGLIGAATVFPERHRDVLREVRRHARVVVVSNFDDTASAYDILHRHGILADVDGVVVSEALGVRKPHPLVMHQGLRVLGLPADAVLLVGDTFAEDVVGAQRVGLDVAWIDRRGGGVPPGARPPTYVVRHLEDVPALLAR